MTTATSTATPTATLQHGNHSSPHRATDAASRVDAAPAFRIEPLTVRTGAILHGLHIDEDLSDAAITQINQALLKHKVVFIRDQQHLSDAAHEAFAARLGPLLPHPARAPREDTKAMLNLDSKDTRSSTWHTDLTFLNAFPKISVLRGVTIPPLGGDTLWANTATAYAHLPAPLKAFVDGLWVRHSNVFDYEALMPAGSATSATFHQKLAKRETIETEHPLVCVHPETNERTLLIGHFIKKIIGFSRQDSEHIFSILHNHVVADENVVRWRWRQGDVAIWDNRATMHRAVDDYGDAERVVRRVTLEGAPARAIDGRLSVTQRGVAA